MIIVTGGAGFIGSNLVKKLNSINRTNLLVVDDLTNGKKFKNLVDADIADYIDKNVCLHKIQTGEEFSTAIEGIFHLGACATTTETDGKYMMENNYEYSKTLLHYCLERGIPFIYASSASVYGSGKVFKEERKYESPLNVYGYSKFQFDQYVRKFLPKAKSQIVGLRYFNVYGPGESHKASMASVMYHFNKQISDTGVVKLFDGSDGYGPGEQRRDFVYVDDVAAVNLWFYDHRDKSGIFNVGTGHSESFLDVANAAIKNGGKGKVEFIPFPENLKGSYQSFTEADLTNLRATGCDVRFRDISQGIKDYSHA